MWKLLHYPSIRLFWQDTRRQARSALWSYLFIKAWTASTLSDKEKLIDGKPDLRISKTLFCRLEDEQAANIFRLSRIRKSSKARAKSSFVLTSNCAAGRVCLKKLRSRPLSAIIFICVSTKRAFRLSWFRNLPWSCNHARLKRRREARKMRVQGKRKAFLHRQVIGKPL